MHLTRHQSAPVPLICHSAFSNTWSLKPRRLEPSCRTFQVGPLTVSVFRHKMKPHVRPSHHLLSMDSCASPSRNRYLTLIEVSRMIASSRCLDDLLHDLAQHLHELLSFQFFALVLYDEERNVMRMHSLEMYL